MAEQGAEVRSRVRAERLRSTMSPPSRTGSAERPREAPGAAACEHPARGPLPSVPPSSYPLLASRHSVGEVPVACLNACENAEGRGQPSLAATYATELPLAIRVFARSIRRALAYRPMRCFAPSRARTPSTGASGSRTACSQARPGRARVPRRACVRWRPAPQGQAPTAHAPKRRNVRHRRRRTMRPARAAASNKLPSEKGGAFHLPIAASRQRCT